MNLIRADLFRGLDLFLGDLRRLLVSNYNLFVPNRRVSELSSEFIALFQIRGCKMIMKHYFNSFNYNILPLFCPVGVSRMVEKKKFSLWAVKDVENNAYTLRPSSCGSRFVY